MRSVAKKPVKTNSHGSNAVRSATKRPVKTNSHGSNAVRSATTKLVKAGEQITEFKVPTAGYLTAITAGPDGNLWYAETGVGTGQSEAAIGTMSSSSGTVIAKYPLGRNPYPDALTTGPDGNIWFDGCCSSVGKITTSGKVTEYKLEEGHGVGLSPGGVAVGEGDLWYTTSDNIPSESTPIVKVTTSGEETFYTLPAETNSYQITAGPEKDMWFTNDYCLHNDPSEPCSIDKITTSGVVTAYPLGGTGKKRIFPGGIAEGSDGNLWFTASGTGEEGGTGYVIGKMTPSGVVTLYSASGVDWGSKIVAGPESKLWFTSSSSAVGSITTSGTVAEYSLASEGLLAGITVGPEGDLWFTNERIDNIGRLTP